MKSSRLHTAITRKDKTREVCYWFAGGAAFDAKGFGRPSRYALPVFRRPTGSKVEGEFPALPLHLRVICVMWNNIYSQRDRAF